MRMFDIDGNLVNVDVRESRHPLKAMSKSTLQGAAGQKLKEKYPLESILEEFPIPGSRMSVDFFIPKKKLIVECDGIQHKEFTPFFHGDIMASKAFANQKSRDRIKDQWAEMNGFRL